MSIKQRIWALPIVAILVSCAGIFANYIFSDSASTALANANKFDYPALTATQTMITTFAGIQENLKYAISANDKNALSLAQQKADNFKKTNDELVNLPAYQSTADTIAKQFNTYFTAAQDSTEIYLGSKQGDMSTAVQAMQGARQDLEGSLKKAKQVGLARFNADLKAGHDDVKNGLLASFVTAMVIVVVLGSVSYLVITSISTNLRRIMERAQNTKEDEVDLTSMVQIDGKDEFGMIAKWINGFIGNLRNLVADVSTIANNVGTSSGEIAKSNQGLASGARSQEEDAAQIARGMEELTTTISSVAANTVAAADYAKTAVDVATQGDGVIQETVAEMHRISTTVDEATRMVEALGNSSTQIGAILDVIRDIAEQTNLLALNAAIEAARAGEQGRGFAVVADEVRTLAKRTSQATGEIRDTVEAIQGGIRSTVQCIAAGKDASEEGKTKATSAQSALDDIIKSIETVNSMIQEIATTAEQQSATAREISTQVVRIVDVANESLQETTKAVDQSETMKAAADQLMTKMRIFKV